MSEITSGMACRYEVQFQIGKRTKGHSGYGHFPFIRNTLETVSYTHLDVYKRQVLVIVPLDPVAVKVKPPRPTVLTVGVYVAVLPETVTVPALVVAAAPMPAGRMAVPVESAETV